MGCSFSKKDRIFISYPVSTNMKNFQDSKLEKKPLIIKKSTLGTNLNSNLSIQQHYVSLNTSKFKEEIEDHVKEFNPQKVPSIENFSQSNLPTYQNDRDKSQEKIFIKLPTFSKSLVKNEVVQLKSTNITIIRKNSLNNNEKTSQNTNIRRKSYAFNDKSFLNKISSPVNRKKATGKPILFRPNRTSSFISKNNDSESQNSLKSPSNYSGNVISFTDVSLYKTNLIDFFREEEKETPKKTDSNLKGIIKNQKKDSTEFVSFSKTSKKPSKTSVFIRFQDQVLENPDDKQDSGPLQSKDSFLSLSSGVNSPASPQKKIMPRFSITLIPLSGLKLNKSESGKKTPTIKEKNKGDIELVNEKINQYVFVKDLGKKNGKTGILKLAFDDLTKKYFMIFVIEKGYIKNLERLDKTIASYKKISHPNLMKLQEVIFDFIQNKYYFVMDYMKNGVFLSEHFLKTQMNNSFTPSILSHEKALFYFQQFLNGMDFLHNTLKRPHGYLHTNSLLIDKNNCLKLSDYWMKDLCEYNLYTLTSLDNANSEGQLKDKNFTVSLLKKMLFGNENKSVTNIAIYESWPEELHKFIEKITDNQINSIDDMMNDDWVNENGNYHFNHLNFDENVPSEKEIKYALTKLTYRGHVLLKARKKQDITPNLKEVSFE